jgi:hypothetical protein
MDHYCISNDNISGQCISNFKDRKWVLQGKQSVQKLIYWFPSVTDEYHKGDPKILTSKETKKVIHPLLDCILIPADNNLGLMLSFLRKMMVVILQFFVSANTLIQMHQQS